MEPASFIKLAVELYLPNFCFRDLNLACYIFIELLRMRLLIYSFDSK